MKGHPNAKTLAAIDFWSKPNYVIMGETFQGPSLQYTDGAPKAEATNWHKLGVSYNATSGTLHYTFDDWFNRTATVNSPFSTASAADAFVRLGTNSRSDLNFQGLVDDVCVYSSPLTLNEVRA